jgi:hypothetical protein
VCYWRKQKEVLRNIKSDSTAFRGPKGELLIYFEELRNDSIAVTHDMLQLRARELAKSHNISDNEFKASQGCLQQFMKRKGLSLHRIWQEAETGDNDVNNSSASESESCLSSDNEN